MATAAEIRTRIDEIDAARSAIVNDNATSVTLGDRQLTRPSLAMLRRERASLVMQLNQQESAGAAFFGRTFGFKRQDEDADGMA